MSRTRRALSVRGRAVQIAEAGAAAASEPDAARTLLAVGAGADVGGFRSVATEALCATRRVLAPDFFGLGASDAPPDDGAPILAHDASVLGSLLIESDGPAHLIGRGALAAAAVRAALDQPEQVASLCLVDPLSLSLLQEREDPRRLEALEAAWTMATRLSFGERDAGLEALAAFWGDAEALAAAEPELRSYWASTLERAVAEFRALSIDAPGALRFDALRAFRGPVLLISGARAPASARATAARFRSAWPQAQIVEATGRGAEAERAVALERFLSAVDAGAV